MATPRPMLASNDVVLQSEFASLSYPKIASPKLDGFRQYNLDGRPTTRSGKQVANLHTRRILTRPEFSGLDGELITGSPTAPDALHKAQSAFTTISGEPDFTWHIFDDLNRGNANYWGYWRSTIRPRIKTLPEWCVVVPQQMVTSAEELLMFHKNVVDMGYEGTVIRAPNSPYKHNRSTRKQEFMLKVKDVTYEEVMIVSFNEKMINGNAAERDELGFSRRSTHKAGKIPANTLGSFTVRSIKSGEEFSVGTGPLVDHELQKIWDRKPLYSHKIMTVKYYSQAASRMKPRSGQFVAWRALEDMS